MQEVIALNLELKSPCLCPCACSKGWDRLAAVSLPRELHPHVSVLPICIREPAHLWEECKAFEQGFVVYVSQSEECVSFDEPCILSKNMYQVDWNHLIIVD